MQTETARPRSATSQHASRKTAATLPFIQLIVPTRLASVGAVDQADALTGNVRLGDASVVIANQVPAQSPSVLGAQRRCPESRDARFALHVVRKVLALHRESEALGVPGKRFFQTITVLKKSAARVSVLVENADEIILAETSVWPRRACQARAPRVHALPAPARTTPAQIAAAYTVHALAATASVQNAAPTSTTASDARLQSALLPDATLHALAVPAPRQPALAAVALHQGVSEASAAASTADACQ